MSYSEETQKLIKEIELKYNQTIEDLKEVNWSYISRYQTLSEEFIREFKDRVNWTWISAYQLLSEDFIREFKDRVDWDCISRFQYLSEEFIREFKDRVIWDYISRYQPLSESFIKEFGLTISSNNWRYKTLEEKKKAIAKCKLYEMDGDYVIAYKSVTMNLSSVYKSSYKYEVGKESISNADYNVDEENSFGLSMWTYDKAKEYYNQGKMLKVKSHINDVAALVHNEYKLRTTKLTVIEIVDHHTNSLPS